MIIMCTEQNISLIIFFIFQIIKCIQCFVTTQSIYLPCKQVKWTDIGGMSEVKMRLQEAVNLPRTNPEALARLGIKPSKGLLMYGPPGCSKTMVARALATECSLNFLAVKVGFVLVLTCVYLQLELIDTHGEEVYTDGYLLRGDRSGCVFS